MEYWRECNMEILKYATPRKIGEHLFYHSREPIEWIKLPYVTEISYGTDNYGEKTIQIHVTNTSEIVELRKVLPEIHNGQKIVYIYKYGKFELDANGKLK